MARSSAAVSRSARVCADTYVPAPPCCTYGLRVPASCVLYAPRHKAAWGVEPRRARTSLGRAGRTAYRGTTGEGESDTERLMSALLQAAGGGDDDAVPQVLGTLQ